MSLPLRLAVASLALASAAPARAQDAPSAPPPPEKPDWLVKLERLHLYGDFRLRQEESFHLDDQPSRSRTRVRLRVGVGYDIDEDFSVGARVVTGDPDDPQSPHATLGDGFDGLTISLDRAFLEYRPDGGDDWVMGGKFENRIWRNPVYGELVWDADVQPEGFSAGHRGKAGGIDTLEAMVGAFSVQEYASANDVWAFEGQVHAQEALSDGVTGDLAVGYVHYLDLTPDGETGFLADNSGNATLDRDMDMQPDDYESKFGILNPIAAVTWAGDRPTTVSAEYIKNLRAENDRDTGWAVGVSNGKARKKGEWSTYYQFQVVEQDAVLSAFSGDDFLLQTNQRGHVAGVHYRLTDRLDLHLWALVSAREHREPGPTTDEDDYQWRVRLDLNVGF